jgi:hypothetical protein
LICPHCRNEKLDQDICPHCGLDEKTALLKSADLARGSGKTEQAITYYDRYLQLSYDPEVNRQRVSCLYILAVSHFDGPWFNKTSEGLFCVLNDDWSWQRGHQCLIDLFNNYGKLELLEKEYERIAEQDESKRQKCESLIETIRLMQKFKENPPIAFTAISDSNSLLKSLWPLSGIPFLLWGMFQVAVLAKAKDENHKPLLIFIFFILGLGVCILILISMNRYKGKDRKK